MQAIYPARSIPYQNVVVQLRHRVQKLRDGFRLEFFSLQFLVFQQTRFQTRRIPEKNDYRFTTSIGALMDMEYRVVWISILSDRRFQGV